VSLKTEVQILGDASSLERATKKAGKDLDKFGKKTKTFSAGMKGMLGGVLAGVSLGAIVNYGRESVKAAVDDNKAQGLLQLGLKNTTKATAAQRAGVEDLIQSMQMQYGIADDELRPAYQKLAASTHSVTKSNELMQIALDASAATGKPLNTVIMQLGRAYNGNVKALDKLIPGLSKAKDPIQALARATTGAAAEVKANNPMAVLDIAAQNIQEQVGNALLPKLQEFSDYLSSPQGTAAVKAWGDAFSWVAEQLTNIIGALTGDINSPLLQALNQIGQTSYYISQTMVPGSPYFLNPIAAAEASQKTGYQIAHPELYNNTNQSGDVYQNMQNGTQNFNIVIQQHTNTMTPEQLATLIKQGMGKYGGNWSNWGK